MDVSRRHKRRNGRRRSVSAHIDATTTPAGPRAAASRITHVLIVDDDEVTRTTLRWPLEDAGYEVHEAADGMAAVDILSQTAVPLVVLLDLMMPRMSGYELLRLLSARPEWGGSHAFIIVTAATGPFGPDFVQPLLAQLAINVVPKPFDLDDLLAAIDAAAGRATIATATATESAAHKAQAHPAQ